jgi:hypothetical protein
MHWVNRWHRHSRVQGDDGEILVEDSHGTELQTELQPAAAMRLAGSYAAHAFLTSEATSTSVLDDPLVLIAGQTISTMEDILLHWSI